MAALQDSIQTALAERYVVEREIGRGGMATVYSAYDVKHDRRVAIKVLNSELSISLATERFLREIKTVARLQHPHVLPLYDSGEAGGALFFVMPYVAGDSLRVRLTRDSRLSVDEALRITADVAGALDYAHRNAVIHRDIKPENILLHDGHAIVADFGIARALSLATPATTLTQTGMAVGTAAYMSPEQVVGEDDIDGRSDIYSLGCVLYEMLTGETPFAGGSAQAVMARRFVEPPPSPRTLRADVPAFVDAIVLRTLAREAGDRFGTAAELSTHIATRAGTPEQPHAGRAHVQLLSANPEANDRYRVARSVTARRDRAKYPAAVVDLERACVLDPSFAAAVALLAIIHLLRADLDADLAESCKAAGIAAHRALEIDPALGEAHAAIAFTHSLRWEWDAASAAFTSAVRHAPASRLVAHWHAIHLCALGRIADARSAMTAALRLEGDDAILETASGVLAYYARDARGAETALRRAIELDPSDPMPHILIAQSYTARGAPADAITECERGVDLAGSMLPLARATLGCAFASMGRRSDATGVCDDLAALGRRADISPFYEAAVRAALGEPRAAIALLQQAVARHDSWAMALKVHPWLDGLRAEPGFIDLISEVGL